MKLPQFFRRGRADGSEAYAAKVAHIAERLEKIVEEMLHAVGAGEDDPIVTADAGDGLYERLVAGRRQDFYRGDFEYFRTEFAELPGQFSGLPAVAGDDDALPEERPVFVPIERVAQSRDSADDRHRRRFEICLGHLGV